MSLNLSVTHQETQGISYSDFSAGSIYTIDTLLQGLLQNPEIAVQYNIASSSTSNNSSVNNNKIARFFITELSDIESALDSVATINTDDDVFFIVEIGFSSAQIATCNNNTIHKENLVKLCCKSDLLIIHESLITNFTYQKIGIEQSFARNSSIVKAMGAKAIAIINSANDACFYLDHLTQAVLCNATQRVSFLNQSGALSASIATFMLCAKRSCDAIVLSFAHLNQYFEQLLNSDIAIRTSFSQWPCNLSYFPQLTTALNYVPDNQVSKSKIAAFKGTNTLSLGLYPVVDSLLWLHRLLELGVKTIQIRIKDTSTEQLDKMIAQAAQLGEKYQARLFINDYWQLAIKHNCYGVHLGQEDLDETDLQAIQQAGLRLGISTHSEYEWLRAISIEPSYIAMGTVYNTQTKPAILIGLHNLKNWCKTLAEHFPIVAIGGIKLDNIDPVLASGVGSIAVVTAITLAEDYSEATALFTAKQQTQYRIV
ncbi:MAG: thiamine-phosphate diphosphorylase [Oceanospirillaceae bacterium]|jgi:thiamine-phosphate diphosphorylase